MEQLTTTTTMTTRMWRNYACGWLAYMLLLVVVLRLANGSPHGFDWRGMMPLLWIVPQALLPALHWPLRGRHWFSNVDAVCLYWPGR